jgi:hypothetical protein
MPFDAPLLQLQAAPHLDNNDMGNRARVRVNMFLYQ